MRCDGCGNEIDPTICWCGNYVEGHGYGDGGHSAIPMGCDCGRTPQWKSIAVDGLPEDRLEVETKIDDGHGVRNVQSLKRQGNLWFYPDMSMYVYYAPTHWRELKK